MPPSLLAATHCVPLQWVLQFAVQANGHRVMVISPRYDQYKDAWDTSVSAEVRSKISKHS